MIKVLNVISDMNIGGAGRVLENYLSSRNKAEFEVSAAIPRGSLLKAKLGPFGVKIYEVDAMRDRSFDLRAVPRLIRVIREENPDIVHTHGAFSGRIAGKRCGKKVLMTRHSAFPLPQWIKIWPIRTVYRILSERFTDRIIAVSPVCRDCISDIGVDPGMTEVLMNGVVAMERSAPEKLSEFRRRFGLREGLFTAGIIARLEPYKGHLYVLEAARDLKQTGRDFRIIAAGTGACMEELRSKAAELGLTDLVLFPGFIEDVQTLYSALDLQINASYVEASSLALLEGMSLGLPSIVSDCGGNPDIIKDGISGFVFPVHDSRKLAERMAMLMDDAELRRKMGAEARIDYETNYTGKVFARKLEDIYRKTMGGNINGQ